MEDRKIYSVKDLIGNRIKPTSERFGLWFLTENLDNNNLVTDIGNVNYTRGEERLLGWEPITDMFCDNIMLVKITDFENCEGSLGSKRFRLSKGICGSFNTYLRAVFKRFTNAKHGVKAKLPISLEKNTNRTQGITQVIARDLELLRNKYKHPVAVPYKIDLADVKLELLLDALPEILERLAMEHYYLLDLDITQDFAGIFDKEEMCEYLRKTHNFGNNYNKIVDNNSTVGIDCLTWLSSNSRIKVYNKFVCQITSPGVTKQLGNHIINFINCPDQRLRETFASELGQNKGITRLEATIYNYSTDGYRGLNPIRDCRALMECSIKYFQNAPFYAVPLSKMWCKLTDCLQNSCCLVYNNLLQYVYWGNSNTKKLTGIQITLPEKNKDKIIKYALSAFSFNCLPVNYIEIVEDAADKITITHKCFVKTGETFFTKSSTPYSTIPIEISIAELGLVQTKNVIPQVLRKRANINSKLLPFPIKEIQPLSKPYIACSRKRSLEMEEMETKRRRMDFIENTASIRDELKREQEITAMEERWRDLCCNGIYKIYAFVVNKRDNFTYVGALAETRNGKAVYYVKGYNKNSFIELDRNRELLITARFLIIPYTTYHGNKLDILYLPTKEPICTFKTNGVSYYNGHSFPKIVNLQFCANILEKKDTLDYVQEEVEQVHNGLMQDILGQVNVVDCCRLEELEEGTELIITAIQAIRYRNRLKYILKFENIQNTYVSNYWLEEEMEDLDFNYKIKIKCDRLKTTPTKHMERLIFCVS